MPLFGLSSRGDLFATECTKFASQSGSDATYRALILRMLACKGEPESEPGHVRRTRIVIKSAYKGFRNEDLTCEQWHTQN